MENMSSLVEILSQVLSQRNDKPKWFCIDLWFRAAYKKERCYLEKCF